MQDGPAWSYRDVTLSNALAVWGPVTGGDRAYYRWLRLRFQESCGASYRADVADPELESWRNSVAIQRSKEYFDRRYVKKTAIYTFVVGDVVLMNIKKFLSNIKNVEVRWIGPCTIVQEQPGK